MMSFLQDPFIQFLLNIGVAFASLVFSAASSLLALQALPKQKKPPRIKPLPKVRTLRGCITSIATITASLFSILYCLAQTFIALQLNSPFLTVNIAISALAIIAFLFLAFINTIRLLRGEPQPLEVPRKTQEERQNGQES